MNTIQYDDPPRNGVRVGRQPLAAGTTIRRPALSRVGRHPHGSAVQRVGADRPVGRARDENRV